MKLFDRLVPKLIEDGHRILIFSQFKLMLNLLEDYFYIKQISILRLDGDTPGDKRQILIDEFNKENSKFPVFLLSTRAGGLGINLTKADTIIIFDSDFNPHNDIQALSRAHRIGQKSNLVVYRLVCADTCEQKIVEVAKQKLMLSFMVSNPSLNPNDIKSNDSDLLELNKILKFGSNKMFDTTSSEYVEKEYTDDFIFKL